MMEIIPAIDLLGGKVVRLVEGRRESAITYADDPASVIDTLSSSGAARLHLVDLDGAFEGPPGQLALVEALLARSRVPVQVGGGIRELAHLARVFEAGAERVILGTAAASASAFLEHACRSFPGRIVVAVDAKDGVVTTHGWTASSGQTAIEVARRAEQAGAVAVLYTDVRRDGTGAGPNVAATKALQRDLSIDVIASGGIGSIEHLRELARGGVRACVLGRAYYERRVPLEAALALAAERAGG